MEWSSHEAPLSLPDGSVDYLEGHGDLVSSLITHISHVINPTIPIINLLAKSP